MQRNIKAALFDRGIIKSFNYLHVMAMAKLHRKLCQTNDKYFFLLVLFAARMTVILKLLSEVVHLFAMDGWIIHIRIVLKGVGS